MRPDSHADSVSAQPLPLIARPAFRNWFWTVPAAAALAVTLFILTVIGSDRDVESLWVFLVKLLPFVFASMAVATFPRHAPTFVKVGLAFASIVPFWTYFVPRQLHFMRQGLLLGLSLEPDAELDPLIEAFDEYYIITQIVVPFVILMVVAAYRLGGGSFANTMKLAIAGLLFMISGIEDITFWIVNDLWPMPEQITWADHMTVRVGRVLSRTEFFIACAVHFVAIAIVFALPVDRWVDRLRAVETPADPVGPLVDLTDVPTEIEV